MRRIRAWFHRQNIHAFCREVQVVDHYDFVRELIAVKRPDGTLEYDDVTNQSGRVVYKTVHG